MKRIFLTGGQGFIGINWTEKLLANGYKVTSIDIIKRTNKFDRDKNYKFIKNTIFNYRLIENYIKKNDIVCHFAGIAEPEKYLKDTINVINLTVLPSFKIIEMCAKYKKKIIFTSTSEIYGNSKQIPFIESGDRLLGPVQYNRWCYSSSKALVEHMICANMREKKLNFIIFRLFNVYGKHLKGRVIDKFIYKAKIGKPLKINGNGLQKRCFLHVTDCMEIFYKILINKKIKNEIINIGQNKETKIYDLAKLIIKLTNSNSKIIKNSRQLNKIGGYQDIIRRVPSLKKLNELIKYKPKVNLKDGLKLMINDK